MFAFRSGIAGSDALTLGEAIVGAIALYVWYRVVMWYWARRDARDDDALATPERAQWNDDGTPAG